MFFIGQVHQQSGSTDILSAPTGVRRRLQGTGFFRFYFSMSGRVQWHGLALGRVYVHENRLEALPVKHSLNRGVTFRSRLSPHTRNCLFYT